MNNLLGLPVRESFQKLNKDGYVDFNQFEEAVEIINLGDVDWDVLTHHFEENCGFNQKLTLENFIQTIQDTLNSTQAAGDPPPVIDGQLKMAFDLYDLDKDGFLKFGEFRQMWKKLNLSVLPRETSKIIFQQIIQDTSNEKVNIGPRDLRSLVLNSDTASDLLNENVNDIAAHHMVGKLASITIEAVKIALKSLIVGKLNHLSPEDFVLVTELYSYFDKNHDQVVELEDIEEVWNTIFLKKIKPRENVAIFEFLDSDHDEVIDFREFKQALGQIPSLMTVLRETESPDDIEDLAFKMFKEIAKHLKLRVNVSHMTSRRGASAAATSKYESISDKNSPEFDDHIIPPKIHGGASTVTTTTFQDHLRSRSHQTHQTKSRASTKTPDRQLRPTYVKKREPANLKIVVDNDDSSDSSHEQLESPFDLKKARYQQNRSKARHLGANPSIGTIPYSSTSSVGSRNRTFSGRRNWSFSSIQGKNRRLTSETTQTTLPPFMPFDGVTKKFHDIVRDPRYLNEVYDNLVDIVEDSAHQLKSEDIIKEKTFKKLTSNVLNTDDAGRLFKLIDEERRGHVTLLKSLFWLEDQLDAIETEAETEFDVDQFASQKIDVTLLPAVPERHVIHSRGDDPAQEDEHSSLPEEDPDDEPSNRTQNSKHSRQSKSQASKRSQPNSHRSDRSKPSRSEKDEHSQSIVEEKSSSSTTKENEKNIRPRNRKVLSSRSRPSVSKNENRKVNDVFEQPNNPYSVDDKIQSSRTPKDRVGSSLDRILQVSRLSEIHTMPATVHRRTRSMEYNMAKIEQNIDVRGRSPSYSKPKREVQKPKKYYNNHARGSIIREPENIILDQESRYSDFNDPRDDEFFEAWTTATCPVCGEGNEVYIQDRYDKNYIRVQCAHCESEFPLSIPPEFVEANRVPRFEEVSEGSTDMREEEKWRRFVETSQYSAPRYSDSPDLKKYSRDASRSKVVRGRRGISHEPYQEDIVVIQGMKYTSSTDPYKSTSKSRRKDNLALRKIPTKDTVDTDHKSYSRKAETTTSENPGVQRITTKETITSENPGIQRIWTQETQDTGRSGMSRSREPLEPGGRKVVRRSRTNEKKRTVKKIINIRPRSERVIDDVSELDEDDDYQANMSMEDDVDEDTLQIVREALWEAGKGEDETRVRPEPRSKQSHWNHKSHHEERTIEMIQIPKRPSFVPGANPPRVIRQPIEIEKRELPEPPEWTIYDTCYWIDKVLGFPESAAPFQKYKIDGTRLLYRLRASDLTTKFLIPYHESRQIWENIEKIRSQYVQKVRKTSIDSGEANSINQHEMRPVEIDDQIVALMERQKTPVPVCLSFLFWTLKWIIIILVSSCFGTIFVACVCTYMYFLDIGQGIGPHRPTRNLSEYYEEIGNEDEIKTERFQRIWPILMTLRESPFRYMFLYFDGNHKSWDLPFHIFIWFTSTVFCSILTGPFVLGWVMEHQWYESVKVRPRVNGYITYGAINEYIRRIVGSPMGFILTEALFLGLLLLDLVSDIFLAITAFRNDRFVIFTFVMIFVAGPFIMTWIRTYKLNSRMRSCYKSWPFWLMLLIFAFDIINVYILFTHMIVTVFTGTLSRPTFDLMGLKRTRTSSMLLLETIPMFFIGLICLVAMESWGLNKTVVILSISASAAHLLISLIVAEFESTYMGQSISEYVYLCLDGKLGVLPQGDAIETGVAERIDYSHYIFIGSNSVHEFQRVTESPQCILTTCVISSETLKALPKRTREDFAHHCQQFRISLFTTEDWRIWFSDEDLAAVSHLLIDSRGRTALHYCADRGEANRVRELLSHGCPPNIKDQSGDTPFKFAVNKGHVEVVKLLIDAGVDPNTKLDRKNRTALMLAVKNGDQEMIKYLLEAGAKAELMDIHQRTVLDIALHNRNREIFHKLLQVIDTTVIDTREIVNSASRLYSQSGMDEWFDAARFNDTHTCEQMLENGINPNVTDEVGNTALSIASRMGKYEIVKILLLKGAKVNILNQFGTSPLLWASRNGHLHCAQELLNAGAKIDIQNEYGNTALMWAAKNAHQDICNDLARFGRGINLQNNAGQTPLLIAVQSEANDIVKDLIHYQADVNLADSRGNTPLHWSIDCENEPCVYDLLRLGADPDEINDEGKVPLELAMATGNASIVRLLEKYTHEYGY